MPPLVLVTPQYVPVTPCTDIWMEFLKLTHVFTKCSAMDRDIEMDDDHMLCISRM